MKVKGHALETVSVRGGIQAMCSCGTVYSPSNPRMMGVWSTWDRPKIKAAHEAHKEGLGE